MTHDPSNQVSQFFNTFLDCLRSKFLVNNYYWKFIAINVNTNYNIITVHNLFNALFKFFYLN